MSAATANLYHVNLAAGVTMQMTADQIRAAYASGAITLNISIWRDGLVDWMSLADLAPELRLPPPPRASSPSTASNLSTRSKNGYTALAFFFGNFGVHNLYIGRVASGICQLGFSLSAFYYAGGTGPGYLVLFAIWLWALCEIAVVNQDGQGRPLRA